MSIKWSIYYHKEKIANLSILNICRKIQFIFEVRKFKKSKQSTIFANFYFYLKYVIGVKQGFAVWFEICKFTCVVEMTKNSMILEETYIPKFFESELKF